MRACFLSVTVTKRRLRQPDSIQLVREQRAHGKQEIAFHARPFCPLQASFTPPTMWSIDPYAKERKFLPSNYDPPSVWLSNAYFTSLGLPTLIEGC